MLVRGAAGVLLSALVGIGCAAGRWIGPWIPVGKTVKRRLSKLQEAEVLTSHACMVS